MNIKKLIFQVNQVLENIKDSYEIIAINDNSTDDTQEVLMELKNIYSNLKIIKRIKNPGVGLSLRSGFKNAKGNIIITMDGDLSHNPQKIETLIKEIDNGADLVIGSRFINQSRMYSSTTRKVISFFYNL